MKKEYPEKSVEFVRPVAEEVLAVLQTHQVWPDNEEYVTMYFFRFDGKGKLWNTGMPFSKFLKPLQAETRCSNLF